MTEAAAVVTPLSGRTEAAAGSGGSATRGTRARKHHPLAAEHRGSGTPGSVHAPEQAGFRADAQRGRAKPGQSVWLALCPHQSHHLARA